MGAPNMLRASNGKGLPYVGHLHVVTSPGAPTAAQKLPTEVVLEMLKVGIT